MTTEDGAGVAEPRAGPRLVGKAALVVGSGSTGDYPGTGSAMARLFAAQGARVVVMGRTDAHTKKTVAEIDAEEGEALAYVGDTTKAHDCDGAVAVARDAWGRLD